MLPVILTVLNVSLVKSLFRTVTIRGNIPTSTLCPLYPYVALEPHVPLPYKRLEPLELSGQSGAESPPKALVVGFRV